MGYYTLITRKASDKLYSPLDFLDIVESTKKNDFIASYNSK